MKRVLALALASLVLLQLLATTSAGVLRSPAGCSPASACRFHLEWQALTSPARIRLSFTVAQGTWAAVGFSTDKFMPGTDIVAVHVPSLPSTPYASNRKAASYSTPATGMTHAGS